MEWLLISLASLLAGFVDSIVGGGGLILLPAMFAVFPNAQPATLFGTNKGAAILGTAVATAQFARRVEMPWSSLLPAAALSWASALSSPCAWAPRYAPLSAANTDAGRHRYMANAHARDAVAARFAAFAKRSPKRVSSWNVFPGLIVSSSPE